MALKLKAPVLKSKKRTELKPKARTPIKLDKLTSLLAEHKLLTSKAPKCTNLKNLLTTKHIGILPTEKMLTAIKADSNEYVAHLRKRMEVIRRYADVHRKVHGETKFELPAALHKEWQLFSNRSHELAQANRLVAASAKANPQLRAVIETHRSQVTELYAQADRVFSESGLTFANVEAREVG